MLGSDGINGTPTIIGDDVLLAVGLDAIKAKINFARCGKLRAT